MAMMGKSNSDGRSADHHVSDDMTGLHSKNETSSQNGKEMNKMATATCRSLHQWKSDTAAEVTRETTEL